jgi:DNA-binding GntR family transcriptional regulator
MSTVAPDAITGRGPAAAEVRAAIEESILSGGLAPGSRVVADEFARRMGVSHIPVREALHALEADGWIVHRPRQGAFVRGHDLTELADLFEARVLLEGEVAELAAQRRTAEQLAALDAVVARQAATDAAAALAAINCEFHLGLAGCAHNTVLAGYVSDLNKRARFYYVTTAAARRDDSLAEHRAILDAVRRRDAAAAGSLVRAHVGDTRGDVARTLTDEPATARTSPSH